MPLVALSNFPEGGIWPSVLNVIIPKEARNKGERGRKKKREGGRKEEKKSIYIGNEEINY